MVWYFQEFRLCLKDLQALPIIEMGTTPSSMTSSLIFFFYKLQKRISFFSNNFRPLVYSYRLLVVALDKKTDTLGLQLEKE